ncbi:MAG: hypothetical protein KF782_35670 [Labilithrix sp.]|nr:hypothetical protein [Labilithrix sp.]
MRRATLAALGLSLLACAEEVIVLGAVPAEDGGGAVASGARCVRSSECGEGSFCDRRQCNAPAGTCEPYPVSCDDEERPVCGCDGVTYWNDCLRRAAGAPGARADECDVESARCGPSGSTCPEGAVCAMLVGFGGPGKPACRGPAAGRCWVLPAICPAQGRADRWDECATNEGALRCLDTCSAIRSGRTFARVGACE